MTSVQEPGPSVSQPRRVGKFRYILIGLLAFINLLAFLDRANLSILIVDRKFLDVMGIAADPARQGLLVTAYLITYGIANIVLGPVIDWLGARRMTLMLVGLWAGFTGYMGLVSSYPLMLLGRLGRGAAEGPQFPLMNRYVRNWFPPRERGAANALWLASTPFATAFGVPFSAFLIGTFGWRASLFIIAALTLFIVGPLVWLFSSDKPEENPWVGEAERALIAGDSPTESGQRTNWLEETKVFAGDYHFWLTVLFHAATLAVYWGLLTWLPKYLAEARGFDFAAMGFFTSLAYFGSAFGLLGFGLIANRFQRRAPLCMWVMLVMAITIALAVLATNPVASALLLALAVTERTIATPNLFTLLQRIIPARVIGAGVGLDNGIANLGSALTPALIGWLIAITGSYDAGLFFLVGATLVGAGAMFVLTLQDY